MTHPESTPPQAPSRLPLGQLVAASSTEVAPPPLRSAESQVGSGGRVVLLTRLVGQAVSIGSLAILYHLIEPEAFGLVALALAGIGVLRLIGAGGLPGVIIQAAELSEATGRRLRWVALGLGAMAGLVGLGLAPTLVSLYSQPALGPVTAALATSCLVAAWSAVVEGRLERALRFADVSRIRLIAQIVTVAVTIGLAWIGWGVWALVVQQVLEFVAIALLGELALRRERTTETRISPAPTLPVSVPPSSSPPVSASAFPASASPTPPPPRTDGRPSRPPWAAIRLGGFLTAAVLITNLGQGLDKIILGLIVTDLPGGEAAVGQYAQAFNLFLRPVYLLAGAVGTIALPALAAVARRQDAIPVGPSPHDRKSDSSTRPSTLQPETEAAPPPVATSQAEGGITPASEDAFARLTATLFRAAAVMLAPIAAGLTVVAPGVMALLGGPPWALAGQTLACLAPAIVAQGLINLCGPVLVARGRGGDLLLATTGWLVALTGSLLVAAAWPLAHPGTPPAADATDSATAALRVATVYTVVTWAALPVYGAFALRRSGVAIGPVVRAITPALATALGMGLIVFGAQRGVRIVLPPMMLETTPGGQTVELGATIALGVVVYVGLGWREVHWLRRFLLSRPTS